MQIRHIEVDPACPSSRFLRQTVVIIPALEEEECIASAVLHWSERGAALVRVVDNGSADGTARVAAEMGAEVFVEQRRGYGAAAWTGTRDLPEGIKWLLFASADGSDILTDESARLFAEALSDGADLVLGERVSIPESRRNLAASQRFGNLLGCSLIRLGWGVRFRDLGSLRLIGREAFQALALADRGFGWNVEMQVRAVEEQLSCREVPVLHQARIGGESKISGSWRGVYRAGCGIVGMIAHLYFVRLTSRRSGARNRTVARSLRKS